MLLNSVQDCDYLNFTLGEVCANIMNEDFLHRLCYANNNYVVSTNGINLSKSR